LPQLPGQVPGPTVIWAADLAQAGARALAELVAAVQADILKPPQHAVVAPDQNDRVRTDRVLEEVARIGDVIDRARQLPDLRPKFGQLACCEVGGDVAVRRYRHRDGPADARLDGPADGRLVGQFLPDHGHGHLRFCFATPRG